MKKYLLMIVLLLSACTDVETCNLQCQKERANAEWKQEQGEFQPNLTPEQERYIVEWLVEHYSNGTQP